MIEMIIAIIITAFVLGALCHRESLKLLWPIKNKTARLTTDDISEIRNRVFTSLENELDSPVKIPARYRREFVDSYLKFCVKIEDSNEDDIIILLSRFKGFSPGLICQLYHTLAAAYLRSRLYQKYKTEWDKEK